MGRYQQTLFKILFIEYNSFKQVTTRKQDEESKK